MRNNIFRLIVLFSITILFANTGICQYKSFELTKRGDTINRVDNKGLKQGLWIEDKPELRGEPAYTEVGRYKNDKKEGEWRVYNGTDDLLAIEHYMFGGKDGICQYFTRIGQLIREESWKGYNPDNLYDTVYVYGTSGEIEDTKIVPAVQYSVKHGTWKYYEASTNRLIRTEEYDRGFPKKQNTEAAATDDKPKPKVKPKEVQDFEKKHSGRKTTKVITGEVHYGILLSFLLFFSYYLYHNLIDTMPVHVEYLKLKATPFKSFSCFGDMF